MTREQKIEKFGKNKDLAFFVEVLTISDNLALLPKTLAALESIQKDLKMLATKPEKEMPAPDFSTVEKGLTAIVEELKKPCEVNLQLE